MNEATPIRPESEQDNSLEIAWMLEDLAAVGDMLCVINRQETLPETIRNVGYFINRHATRIDELLYGGAK